MNKLDELRHRLDAEEELRADIARRSMDLMREERNCRVRIYDIMQDVYKEVNKNTNEK